MWSYTDTADRAMEEFSYRLRLTKNLKYKWNVQVPPPTEQWSRTQRHRLRLPYTGPACTDIVSVDTCLSVAAATLP